MSTSPIRSSQSQTLDELLAAAFPETSYPARKRTSVLITRVENAAGIPAASASSQPAAASSPTLKPHPEKAAYEKAQVQLQAKNYDTALLCLHQVHDHKKFPLVFYQRGVCRYHFAKIASADTYKKAEYKMTLEYLAQERSKSPQSNTLRLKTTYQLCLLDPGPHRFDPLRKALLSLGYFMPWLLKMSLWKNDVFIRGDYYLILAETGGVKNKSKYFALAIQCFSEIDVCSLSFTEIQTIKFLIGKAHTELYSLDLSGSPEARKARFHQAHNCLSKVESTHPVYPAAIFTLGLLYIFVADGETDLEKKKQSFNTAIGFYTRVQSQELYHRALINLETCQRELAQLNGETKENVQLDLLQSDFLRS
jgi:hypothetical protein